MGHVRMSRMKLRERVIWRGSRVETMPADECRSMGWMMLHADIYKREFSSRKKISSPFFVPILLCVKKKKGFVVIKKEVSWLQNPFFLFSENRLWWDAPTSIGKHCPSSLTNHH